MNPKFKILIVEDEMIIAANVSLNLQDFGYEVTGIVPRVEDVMAKIEENIPDIIMMDINLKGEIDGIDMAHIIHKELEIPIIFLTANSDEAHFNRAKAVHPYAFISKPFKKSELRRTLELATIRILEERKLQRVDSAPFILQDRIFIKSHDKMIKVSLESILYIEADRNYCKIYCTSNEHLIVSTLKDIEEKLTAKFLMRIHRSYIVNLRHIDEIATSHVVIGKKAIPITSDLKKQLLIHIQKI